ncbi:mannose-6-phosphate isomerase, class I [Dactylosporangium sp. AC04546]|uniref:mannose-6-phosphate isomerase, class I n=1 Tax=Dactylosporangium sp. AC04546 TaxID=2862460 RepID=UPI001EE0A716|nr:mannose-6-phosphate isomerase, class I [Dactylosporangium sp. AC04546]WVK82974.1 mannose-6-phosphate isomerase, class I [Dactylosporangium sp. AC04546]
MELLESPTRKYAWGSHTAIATLQGRPAPTDDPEAELWMGAHPASPSRLAVSGMSLVDAVAADPETLLGPRNVERFGLRLPFLLKVLAAAQPLSLQAHPDLERARERFAAGHASYVDAWHKPEMLVAVTEFDALCGFRDPATTARDLAALNVPRLKATIDALSQPDPARALRDAVRGLLGQPDPELVADVVAASRPGELISDLAAQYPGDTGVIVATLLNRVRLRPSEAVWMPAGNLHAYLQGVGVEIMAASDNVLRGGLTPKHVDVEELLGVLRFEVLQDPVTRPVALAPGLTSYPVPIEDFTLHRAVLSAETPAVRFPAGGPRIVLCLRGTLRVDDGVVPVALTQGQAAFAPASRPELAVSGTGEAYQAATP